MSDLRALLQAVEAGTAVGKPNSRVVPRDMSAMIDSIVHDEDGLWWPSFVGAHDGCIDDAVRCVGYLLPGWDWMVSSAGLASVISEDGYVRQQIPGNPARAMLLAALRAKLKEGGE